MATSAPLTATRRLMHSSARLRDQPASRRGSPIYSASPFTPCRRPYSGGAHDCFRRCLHRESCLRHFRTGSATTSPTIPDHVGRVTKLQRSLYATAWRCCLPRSGQGFYHRACVDRVAPESHAGYHWMVHRHLPSPDFHRLDWQPYGLRAKYTNYVEFRIMWSCAAKPLISLGFAGRELHIITWRFSTVPVLSDGNEIHRPFLRPRPFG
jgi:hypothetical protein